MTSASRRHARSGFTMVELLVATALLGIITVYLFNSFTVSQRAYAVVDQVVETQQNTRAIGDLIERDIRHAGFMVPSQAAVCGLDNTGASDLLYLSDAGALEPGTNLSPNLGGTVDPGTTNLAGGNPSGTQTLKLDSIVLDGDPAYDTNGDGVKDSDFQVDFGVIIADRDDPLRGTACGTVTAVNIGADEISVDIVTGPLLAAGAVSTPELVAVPAIEYRLNGMVLLRNNMVLAQDVEDLQFALLVDDNDNFQEDAGEYRGDGNAADYTADEGVDPHDFREMRVNVVVRTRMTDQTFSDGQFQATENRVAVAGNDGFRRRVQTNVARLRNVMNRTAL